jgi:hypothetical protein
MSRTMEHAVLAFWAYCFAGGLKFTFLASRDLAEYYWPIIKEFLG